MSAIVQPYIDEYLGGLLPEESPSFKALREDAESQNLPIIGSEIRQLLKFIAITHRPERVLEIGTAIGYSACVFAEAMGGKGQVITVERSEKLYTQAKENIQRLGYDHCVEIIEGDERAVLKELEDVFDLIFLDGGKGHYPHLLEDSLRLLSSGGLIVADNVLYKGMVANRALVNRREITIVKRMQQYLNAVTTDERLETTVLPVGDGVAISVKR